MEAEAGTRASEIKSQDVGALVCKMQTCKTALAAQDSSFVMIRSIPNGIPLNEECQ